MKLILFLFDTIVPVVAFAYVMLFNGGTWIDAVVLIMSVLGILVSWWLSIVLLISIRFTGLQNFNILIYKMYLRRISYGRE